MTRLKEFQGIEGADFFELDRGFQTILGGLLPGHEKDSIFLSLHECARLVSGPWNDLAREGSRAENLPKIIKYDRVGNRVERVDFGPYARRLRREVAEFGLLTNRQSELHKFAIIYLLSHNGEASLTCGISCTDGLIRAIEACGSEFLRETYLPRLRSIETPFAGAQFVTEQSGGSDVGAIEAEAEVGDDGWKITGEKWFCSNPDEFYLVAARVARSEPGTKGVAVFHVPRVLPDGSLNSISFKRLKNKLGTQSLPTAEIDFEGATGYPIGDTGKGFKTLMNYVINASRVHNSTGSCGLLHRAFLEARNYARQREAFGGALITYPLIQETLVALLEKSWRYRLLTFKLIALIDEHGIAPRDADQMMWQRFLLNLAKYRTAATLARSIQEAIMVLGANGIVEDFTILPRLLRDALILETWEGPHNTLCLQIMRDAARSELPGRWVAEIQAALEAWPQDFLSFTRAGFEQVFNQTKELFTHERIQNTAWASTHARRVVDRLGALLEIAWMANLAARHSNDATAALLTSVAGYNLLPLENAFEHPALGVLARDGVSLIEEQAIQSDVNRL